MSEGQAIAALLVNILVPLFAIPVLGIGSFIGGRNQEGILQLVLGLVAGILLFMGIILAVLIVPIILIPIAVLVGLGAYAWSIVTGVQVLQEAKAQAL